MSRRPWRERTRRSQTTRFHTLSIEIGGYLHSPLRLTDGLTNKTNPVRSNGEGTGFTRRIQAEGLAFRNHIHNLGVTLRAPSGLFFRPWFRRIPVLVHFFR